MRRIVSRSFSIVLAVFLQVNGKPVCAFTSIQVNTFTAAASISGTSPSALTIQATPLPSSAFFGKNVVIPVQVTSNPGPISSQNLSVFLVYQLYGPNGNLLSAPVSVPVNFAASGAPSNTLTGSAIIQASDLQSIANGGRLDYIFVAKQAGAGAIFNNSGAAPTAFDIATSTSLPNPLQTTIINQICMAVSPSGSVVTVPDLFVHDGQTSVSLAPGAISAPGTLCITEDSTSGWPAGPGGTKPAVVYTITLTGTTLIQDVGLTLSYPADVNGNVLGLNVNANDLGIYWLGPEGLPIANERWSVLSRAQIDTTLHTVAGVSGHFSTFGLFAGSGTTAAASIRPAQRIITPNGNSPKAFFGSGIDDIHIFDIRGRRVRTIPGSLGYWDATDDGGSIVESGIYIYQYTTQGERVSGVIMVAK